MGGTAGETNQAAGRGRLLIAGIVVAGGLVAMGVAVGGAAADERSVLQTWIGYGRSVVPTRRVEAIDRPVLVASAAVRAEAAGLSRDAPVIGVVVGGKARAYLVSALASVRRHVVNDRVGRLAVAVAYCDRKDCAKAYTGADGPTALVMGGWAYDDQESGMLVRVGSHRYFQDTGTAVDPAAPAFPYDPVAVERTSWVEWRSAHPDTDVYVGAAGEQP